MALGSSQGSKIKGRKRSVSSLRPSVVRKKNC